MKQLRTRLAAAMMLAVGVLLVVPPPQGITAESNLTVSDVNDPIGANPYVPHLQANFYVGDAPYQAYVQHLAPRFRLHKLPVVFIHGAGFDGSYWLATPDGREGWAPYLLRQGWEVYLVDWPGHGRSFHIPDDRFRSVSLQKSVDSVVAVLKEVGPAVLLTHSVGGAIGWKVADTAPQLVKAIVAIAPSAPANLLPVLPITSPAYTPENAPSYPDPDNFRKFWTSTPTFPQQAFDNFFKFGEPESARALNQRINILGEGLYVNNPKDFAGIPVLVQIGDYDPRHSVSSDKPIADYFGGDFIYLPAVGLPGHGHFMAIEHGNLQVADVFLAWLKRKGF